MITNNGKAKRELNLDVIINGVIRGQINSGGKKGKEIK